MSKELSVVHETDGYQIGYMKLYDLAARSQWGQVLAVQSRWGRYKPPYFSLPEWQDVMGVDVNNLKHLKLTYGITRWFLEHCVDPPPAWQGAVTEASSFSAREESLLLLGANIHDLGEAITGDKPGPDKVALDAELEWRYLHTITREITADMPALQKDTEQVIEDILRDTDTKLGRAFQAIELLGYHLTAIRAWWQSENPWIIAAHRNDDLVSRLQALTFSVYTHNVATIIDASHIYPAVLGHLEANRDFISQIYDTSASKAAGTLHVYNSHKTLKDLTAKYTANRDHWNTWKAAHPES